MLFCLLQCVQQADCVCCVYAALCDPIGAPIWPQWQEVGLRSTYVLYIVDSEPWATWHSWPSIRQGQCTHSSYICTYIRTYIYIRTHCLKYVHMVVQDRVGAENVVVSHLGFTWHNTYDIMWCLRWVQRRILLISAADVWYANDRLGIAVNMAGELSCFCWQSLAYTCTHACTWCALSLCVCVYVRMCGACPKATQGSAIRDNSPSDVHCSLHVCRVLLGRVCSGSTRTVHESSSEWE